MDLQEQGQKSRIPLPRSGGVVSSPKPAPDSALYKLLKTFGLKNYALSLHRLGFGEEVHAIAQMSAEQLEGLFNKIGVISPDREKFKDMIKLLQNLQPQDQSRKRSSSHTESQQPTLAPPVNTDRRRGSFSDDKAKTLLSHVPGFQQIVSRYGEIKKEEAQISPPKLSPPPPEENEQQKLRRELEEARMRINELTAVVNKQQEELKRAEVRPKSPTSPIRSESPTRMEPLYKAERKEVGVSYDSSRMRSTLTYIDLEEMCRCLSKAIWKHILHSQDVKALRQELTHADEDLRVSLRSSISSIPDFYEEIDRDSIRSRNSLLYREEDTGEELDILGDNCEVKVPASIERLFMQTYTDPLAIEGRLPSETEIYNFCKNVIVRSRMEKECSIICLIYIERLIAKTGLYIDELTWKRLLLTALILASKIWDDESYENIHFSKVLTLFRLEDINNFERMYLNLVDYNVGVKSSEYAKYYFILRTYAEKNNRSFPLRPLDVDTIRDLQKKTSRAEGALREIHAESLYKTLQLNTIFYIWRKAQKCNKRPTQHFPKSKGWHNSNIGPMKTEQSPHLQPPLRQNLQ